MKTPALRSLFALGSVAALIFVVSCSDSTTEPEPEDDDPEELPETFPPIPRPTSPNEVIPDESEIYVSTLPIEGKAADFAPHWTEGRFTWDVDIQTTYDRVIGGWGGDPPGNYWNGTAPSSDLTFEGGVVDLRNPTPYGSSWGEPHPRRVLFIEQGVVLESPRNPERDEAIFQFESYYPQVRFEGGLFSGHAYINVDPAFGEYERRRVYYVAATSCEPLEKPVYIKRERYWKRLALGGDGNNLKSIRVDPGSTFEVSYTRTQGTSHERSYDFTRTISGEVSLQTPNEVAGAKLSGSLSETFGSSVTITEETEITVTRTMAGVDGKTVIYSVWTSVERYSFVDAEGNPYVEPNYTFEDLGNAEIQGEYEWISSTTFDYVR